MSEKGQPTWKVTRGVGVESVTFKVDSAVPIHIGFLDNLGDLPGGQPLPQKSLHGLPQLSQGDLPVAVGVKLNRGRRGTMRLTLE